MGLFDWLKGGKKEPPKPDLTSLLGPEPRKHHYLFAHREFPGNLWHGDSILGILANPENQDFVVNFWNDMARNLEPKERVPAKGIRYSSHWLGGEHLVMLIELPAAINPPEAQFVAITTSPEIRYITLEKSVSLEGGGIFVLAEWSSDGTHANFGEIVDPTPAAFLRAVSRLLSVPETVEAPTRQQLLGMKKGGQHIDMTIPAGLPKEDEKMINEWEEKAENAITEDNYKLAEQHYRQILELRMSRQGPENTIATLAHSHVAMALSFQGKYREAENLCRIWWNYCRRYRMLGHAETMSAIKMIAENLQSQGKQQEATEIMSYRALLAGLSRGANSDIAIAARNDLTSF